MTDAPARPFLPPVEEIALSSQDPKEEGHEGDRLSRTGDIRVDEVPRPEAGPGEAVIRVTLTTICGTDLHIVRGEYPVRPGLSSATSRSA